MKSISVSISNLIWHLIFREKVVFLFVCLFFLDHLHIVSLLVGWLVGCFFFSIDSDMKNCNTLSIDLFRTASLPRKNKKYQSKNAVFSLARDEGCTFQWNKTDTFDMVDSSFYYHWTKALQFCVLFWNFSRNVLFLFLPVLSQKPSEMNLQNYFTYYIVKEGEIFDRSPS